MAGYLFLPAHYKVCRNPISHGTFPLAHQWCLLNRGSAPMLRLLANAKLLFYGGYFCRSQVFKAMFENEDGLHTACLENPIILPDISPETFLCLLEFLYTNCCTLNEENVSQKIMKLDCIHIIYLIRLITWHFGSIKIPFSINFSLQLY